MGELEGELVPSVKPAPSAETAEELIKRCCEWYTHSIVGYISSRIKQGILAGGSERGPECILIVSHGALIKTLLRTLVGSRMIMCASGVVVGHCANTGVSVIDYSIRREGELMGTLLMYSDARHLAYLERVHDNADESVQ